MRKARTLLVVVFTLTAFAYSAPNALAQKYYNNYPYFIGDRAAGMSGAFCAGANDASSSWYNPAGLAEFKGSHMNISVNTYQYTFLEDEKFFTIDSGDEQTDYSFKESSLSIIPTTAVFTYELGDIYGRPQVAAFSVFVPAMWDSTLLNAAKPEGLDIRSLYYLRTKARHYLLGPSYAVALSDRLRIGAGVFGAFIEGEKHLTQGFYAESKDPYGLGKYYDTLFMKITKNESYAFTMNCGVQYALFSNIKLGFCYQSPMFQLRSEIETLTTINEYDLGTDLEVDELGHVTTTYSTENKPTYTDPVGNKRTDTVWKKLGPGRFQFGVMAAIGERFSVEIDLDYYDEFGDMNMLSVTNVLIGCMFKIKPDMPLYLGIYTDKSPMEYDDEDLEFGLQEIDITGVTAAISIPTVKSSNEESLVKNAVTTIGLDIGFISGDVYGTHMKVGDIWNTSLVKEKASGYKINVIFSETIKF